MSEEVVIPDDIIEEILVRLDLKDLVVHCNRICKSWRSLVSGSRFAVSHFTKHSNTNSNNTNKRWRICIIEDCLRKHLIGSSNGLVCIFTPNAQIIVANPLTGEVKKLENTDDELRVICNNQWFWLPSDDYKVILGRSNKNADLTCFHVLSLKSNAWKFVGDVKCSFVRMVPYKAKDDSGILCNGALHWFVLHQHKNPAIFSFDLSTEEFKEIPQPDDTSYEKHIYCFYSTGFWCVLVRSTIRPGHFMAHDHP
uniref:F-box/kelch-repeat protein At3g06240-like n=1 Tax=Erigeron canadensis TaxID=72917 RepID=UPI001CB938D4|nr:F-box/kelch-repeat protein At3g06240-like [Erigeron canadensis]